MKHYSNIAKKTRLARELKCRKLGFDLAVGVDEAGRGPLAGPVSAAAAAILDLKTRDGGMRYLLAAVKDSKKLSEKKREAIYEIILNNKNIAWASAMVPPKIIDKINILEASKMAMAKAVAGLIEKIGAVDQNRIFCLIDGNFKIGVSYFQESIIAGDAKVFSISAASIIAKVERDRYMAKLDKKYPAYGFARHKGYPTAAHRKALSKFGPCPAHRKSFGPCKSVSR